MAVVYLADEVMMHTSRCLRKWREVADGLDARKMETAMGHYVAALEAEIRFWRDKYYDAKSAAKCEEILGAIDRVRKLVERGMG